MRLPPRSECLQLVGDRAECEWAAARRLGIDARQRTGNRVLLQLWQLLQWSNFALTEPARLWIARREKSDTTAADAVFWGDIKRVEAKHT